MDARHHEITVSLTTTSRRIGRVAEVVTTLTTQDAGLRRVVLWLSREPHLLDEGVSEEQLPQALRELENDRFQIRWTPNIGPYRKLLPALEAFGGTIVTADDDTLYPQGWLAGLLTMSRESPGAVCAYRAHRMQPDGKGGFLGYWRWPRCDSAQPAHDCFPTGKDGVLYPAGSLHADVHDTARLLALAPTSDDIWFKVMALRQGTPARSRPGHEDFPLVGRTANLGGLVSRYNLFGIDAQLAQVFAAFDLDPDCVGLPSTPSRRNRRAIAPE